MSASHPETRQAVILAGGLGTRLRPLTVDLPKPMLAFHGKPFAAYLLEMLRDQGICEVIFLLGYLPDAVRQYFGDGGKFGLSVRYSILPPEADTGARLRAAAELLEEQFLLMYCDNYWPIQLDRMSAFWRESGAEAMLTVYSNEDGWTRSNVRVSGGGIIEDYDKTRSRPGLLGVDIGFGFFRKEHVLGLPEGNVNFEREVYPGLVERKQLAAFVTRHRYYSVGSLERLEATSAFLSFPKVVFLDRDGVLNRKPDQGHYVTNPGELEWLPGSLEGVAYLTGAGYQICVITNQAGVARGMVGAVALRDIHQKLRDDAAGARGHIAEVLCCPHHWDEKCLCRKPEPGLFFAAQRIFNCDLSRCAFVGDQEEDRLAAQRAGCRFELKTKDRSLLEIARDIVNLENS